MFSTKADKSSCWKTISSILFLSSWLMPGTRRTVWCKLMWSRGGEHQDIGRAGQDQVYGREDADGPLQPVLNEDGAYFRLDGLFHGGTEFSPPLPDLCQRLRSKTSLLRELNSSPTSAWKDRWCSSCDCSRKRSKYSWVSRMRWARSGLEFQGSRPFNHCRAWRSHLSGKWDNSHATRLYS